LHDGIGIPSQTKFKSEYLNEPKPFPRVSLADYYKIETESGHITQAMTDEIRKRLKK
jgi:hypothetical protein